MTCTVSFDIFLRNIKIYYFCRCCISCKLILEFNYKTTILHFLASEAWTPTTTSPSEYGSSNSCSNHPTFASNTPEVSQVHDIFETDNTTIYQLNSPSSPIIDDIPSPDHNFVFSSIDLPLCQPLSTRTCITKCEITNWEQRRLEFRQSSINKIRSFKRCIASHVNDNSVKESIGNTFPEKRQSDPHIRYAFKNHGFEMFAMARRYSFNQLEMHRRAMPNINEYSFEEDLDHYHIRQWPVDSLTSNADDIVPIPRFKVRICGDQNQQFDIDTSFESTSSGEYSDSYLEMIDDPFVQSESEFIDPFKINNDCNEKNMKKCTNCGHKYIKRQFTNSFT